MPIENNEDDLQVTQGFGKKTYNTRVLTLPSGARVRCRRPGLEALLKEGVVDKFDTLTAIVESETIPGARGLPPKKPDMTALLKDPQAIVGLITTMDKIAMAVVVEPTLHSVPVPLDENKQPIKDPSPSQVDELRDPEKSYVDYVETDDKMFIMNYAVGGSSDLEQFRAQSQAALGLLHDGEATPMPTA